MSRHVVIGRLTILRRLEPHEVPCGPRLNEAAYPDSELDADNRPIGDHYQCRCACGSTRAVSSRSLLGGIITWCMRKGCTAKPITRPITMPIACAKCGTTITPEAVRAARQAGTTPSCPTCSGYLTPLGPALDAALAPQQPGVKIG